MTEKSRKDYRISSSIVLLILLAWLASLVLVWKAKPIEQEYTEVIQKASQAVVAIKTKVPRNRMFVENEGSGFFIDSDGLILTNEHVVHNTRVIRVTLADKRKFVAKVVGADIRNDLAILKIDGENFSTLPLAPAEELTPGQVVIALGNPFGTGADGIAVSQIGQISRLQHKEENLDPAHDRFYNNLIQTTAVIYPGNSGGPLIDKNGNAVGLNTAMGAALGNDAQFGFAIAFDIKTRSILEQLKAGAAIFHAFLGVETEELDENTCNLLDLKDISGALVSMVLPGSPAQQTDIRIGDVIRAVDNQNIYGPNDLTGYINSRQPGTIVQISLLRKVYDQTRQRRVSVRLEERTMEDLQGYAQEAKLNALEKWGMAVKNLTTWRRKKMQLPQFQPGVMVYSVAPGSPADLSNIRPGMIITTIGYNRIDNLDDFARVAQKHPLLPRLEILKRQD
jgi:serine protease Do